MDQQVITWQERRDRVNEPPYFDAIVNNIKVRIHQKKGDDRLYFSILNSPLHIEHNSLVNYDLDDAKHEVLRIISKKILEINPKNDILNHN